MSLVLALCSEKVAVGIADRRVVGIHPSGDRSKYIVGENEERKLHKLSDRVAVVAIGSPAFITAVPSVVPDDLRAAIPTGPTDSLAGFVGTVGQLYAATEEHIPEHVERIESSVTLFGVTSSGRAGIVRMTSKDDFGAFIGGPFSGAAALPIGDAGGNAVAEAFRALSAALPEMGEQERVTAIRKMLEGIASNISGVTNFVGDVFDVATISADGFDLEVHSAD